MSFFGRKEWTVDKLAFARAQMGMSLAFHIVFAAIGIALPLAIFIVEGLFLWSGQQHYLRLARRWAKVMGLLFAVGAISGTALSFELGLLWPKYMQVMGAAVGQAFGLEGFAFFIEGIFIGLYLYGWRRMRPVSHWLCAGVIAISGAASGALVLAVNAWMQIPVGVRMDAAGNVISTNPTAIFRTYAWVVMSIHSSLACYEAVPLLMAGIYAHALLKGRRDAYCRSAMIVCMSIGGLAAVLQPFSGDAIAKFVFRTQPAKFAAMEAEFETRSHAPMHLGGFPDLKARKDRGAIEIPDLLSFLADHSFSTRVTGLNDIPQSLWPNVRVVHWAFDLMVCCGMMIAIVSILFWIEFAVFHKRIFEARGMLWLLVIVGPLGLVALEAGWFVTELGRQPWIIQGIMLTRDAVTPSAQVPTFFFLFALLYLSLAIIVIVLVRRGKIEPHEESDNRGGILR